MLHLPLNETSHYEELGDTETGSCDTTERLENQLGANIY